MKELTPLQNLCFRIGAVLMLVGAAIYIMYPVVGMYVYGFGTLLFALMQVKAEYLGRSITLIRLRRQQLLACCCFVVALVMMSMQQQQWGPFRRQEWVLALTIGCFLELYTSFRIPQELKKDTR
ncbi:MAG: hypothetical protein IJS63_09835 [Bacteroidaceae bacterium]|nr:hypothetical protein [Bacteroidaceae bacterium]